MSDELDPLDALRRSMADTNEPMFTEPMFGEGVGPEGGAGFEQDSMPRLEEHEGFRPDTIIPRELPEDDFQALCSKYFEHDLYVNEENVEQVLDGMADDLAVLLHETMRARSENAAWRRMANDFGNVTSAALESVRRFMKYAYDTETASFIDTESGRQIDFGDELPTADAVDRMRTTIEEGLQVGDTVKRKIVIGPIEPGQSAEDFIRMVERHKGNGIEGLSAVMSFAREHGLPIEDTISKVEPEGERETDVDNPRTTETPTDNDAAQGPVADEWADDGF